MSIKQQQASHKLNELRCQLCIGPNQPARDAHVAGAWRDGLLHAAHKACHTKLAPHNEGVSTELGPFPVCRDEAARGAYASGAPPQAVDLSLNAQLNRTAEVLC